MEFKLIEVFREGKIERVKMLQPVINKKMVMELMTYFRDVRVDDEIRAVILKGPGDGIFSEGFDMAERSSFLPIEAEDYSRMGQSLLLMVENLHKVVIAQIEGKASAEGFELALACPIRIASDNAVLDLPQVGLGTIPGWGGVHRLSRIIGMSRAIETIIMGKALNAKQAQEMGLLNGVFPVDELEKECLKMGETILTKGPVAVRLVLEVIHRGIESSLEIGGALESSFMALCYSTEDKDEGLKAFFEKRSPDFKGI